MEKSNSSCCQVVLTEVIFGPGDQHYGRFYGKQVCSKCGRFKSWLPTPKVPITGLRIPEVPEGTQLPCLQGSPAQIKWATSLRIDLLADAEQAGCAPKLYRAMSQITDSAWWITQRDRTFADIRWPADWLPGAEHAPARDLDDLEAEAAYVRETRPARPAAKAPVSGPDVAPQRAFEARLEAAKAPFDCVLRVTFDGGRSSGSFTLSRHELRQIQHIIGDYFAEE